MIGAYARMYGYLRCDLAEHEGQIKEWEDAIRAFAAGQGFDLGRVFHECDASLDRPVFAELIGELQRAGSQHVVVPSMGHVWGRFPQLRQELVARLSNEAGAGIWVADLDSNRIEPLAANRHGKRAGAEPHAPVAVAVVHPREVVGDISGGPV